MRKKLVQTDIVLDWKEQLELEQLQQALKPFGIVVIAHPACEDSDAYGFIFSNRPLTQDEVQEAREAM